MGVQVDASRQEEHPARVDLTPGLSDFSDPADALAGDREVPVTLAVCRDSERAADC
jgi:hypothetical protein